MSYLLYLVLPVVGFLLAVAFARYRASAWSSAILQGVIAAVVTLGINAIVTLFDTDCCAYVFDSDDRLGWNVPNTDTDRALRGGAFVSRRYSAERAYGKGGSLQVTVDLRGGTGRAAIPMNRGEVFVLLQQFPPIGRRVGVAQNLWFSRVEAIVDVPATLVSQQSAVTASFVQLYFETCPPQSERFDGEPGEQIHGEGPIRVSYRWWTLKATEACRLGIKMGLNDADFGSYSGEAFISGVRWTPLSWYLQRLAAIVLLIVGVAVYIWLTRKPTARASGAVH